MLPALFLTIASMAAPVAPTIVVTGVRLETLEADLARCVAAGCPTRQDIVATVRYAEGLFRTGRYQDAKRVLAKSIDRNKKAAAADPVAVSELYLAQVNVSNHEGDQAVARKAAVMRARVLTAAMPDTPAALLAEMGVADQTMRTTDRMLNVNDATRSAGTYRDVAARARAGGRPTIAAAATLREASLAFSRGRPAEAERLLGQVAATPGPDMAGYRLAARVLQTRLARARGDDKATDIFLAALAKEPPQTAPALLWSQPLPDLPDPAGLDPFQRVDRTSRSGDQQTIRWVDIGFTIRPDGMIEQPEMLRGSRHLTWAAPVLKSVASRRYTPFGLADGAGQYRVERFTLTADYATPIGSLIARRGRNPRIERMDITGGVPRKLG